MGLTCWWFWCRHAWAKLMLASQVAEGEEPPPEAKVMVCLTTRLQMVSPQINTPNGLEMIQRNGLQKYDLILDFRPDTSGRCHIWQKCFRVEIQNNQFLLIGVYPSENQQGIQIQQGNHFANLYFCFSCHFMLHEGRGGWEKFVKLLLVLGDFSEKTLGWISQHNLLVKHEITSLRLFADLYHWAPFSRRVAVESSYHWLFISQLLLVSPKISIY